MRQHKSMACFNLSSKYGVLRNTFATFHLLVEKLKKMHVD